MANLRFNPYAYELEAAIKIIRRGMEAAERALNEDDLRLQAELQQFRVAVANGDERGYEFDDDGDIIHDPEEGFAFEFGVLEDTLTELRKAMLVTLYHAWEKVARDVTGRTKSTDTHAVLVRELGVRGIAVTPELNQLRRLVNLVKHSSKIKVMQLWPERPDLFYENFDPDRHFPNDWAQTIRLDSRQVDSFFAAVIASGPRH